MNKYSVLPISFLANILSGHDKLNILIFHRIHPEKDPLFPDEITREEFDKKIEIISRAYNVLPLDYAVEKMQSGKLPRRAVCITFDDGYADNHDVALPILKKWNVPATFFIATGFVDGGIMWNDTIIESIRLSNKEELDLSLFGLEKINIINNEKKRESIENILVKIKYMKPEEREKCITYIKNETGTILPDDLMMTSDMIKNLHKAGMIIGAHTVTHPILANIDIKQAKLEIEESKNVLNDLLGEEIDIFAYPNGKPGSDYNTQHPDLLRETGFKVAVSTCVACASRQDDVLQLPRQTPWDKNPYYFAIRMALGYTKRCDSFL